MNEIVKLHEMILQQSAGLQGLRDAGALDSAIAQPRMAFGGVELYLTIVEKAAALGFSLVMNHPFMDGNKRIGHAAMETFLVLNGYELLADTDDQEKTILQLAAGELDRETFTMWVRTHISKMSSNKSG